MLVLELICFMSKLEKKHHLYYHHYYFYNSTFFTQFTFYFFNHFPFLLHFHAYCTIFLHFYSIFVFICSIFLQFYLISLFLYAKITHFYTIFMFICWKFLLNSHIHLFPPLLWSVIQQKRKKFLIFTFGHSPPPWGVKDVKQNQIHSPKVNSLAPSGYASLFLTILKNLEIKIWVQILNIIVFFQVSLKIYIFYRNQKKETWKIFKNSWCVQYWLS